MKPIATEASHRHTNFSVAFVNGRTLEKKTCFRQVFLASSNKYLHTIYGYSTHIIYTQTYVYIKKIYTYTKYDTKITMNECNIRFVEQFIFITIPEGKNLELSLLSNINIHLFSYF